MATPGYITQFYSSQGMAPCLLRYAGPSPSTNEDLLNFLVAFDWQHIVLGTKSGVCNNVPYVADLRRIALESGNW